MMERGQTARYKHFLLLTIILPILLSIAVAIDFPSVNDKSLDLKIERGKGEIEKLQRMMEASKLPHQQTCWKSALEDLHVSCKQLSEEKQSRLAFAFTSCFTRMTGMGEYMCEETTDIKDCFRAFDPAVMHIFHSYFIHTQDMCFFLQHQIWQEQTNLAVDELKSAASDVTQSIRDSRDAQAEILEAQKESARVQSELAKDQGTMYSNVLGFKEVFDEFRVSTQEQRTIFHEMYEKLTRMQKLVGWIQGEMSFFDTMAFYLMCLVFSFVATATRRTHEARFWLVLLFGVSLACERYLFKLLAADDRDFTPEDIHYYIWILRKGTAATGLILVLVAAGRYRDYNILNNNMLSHLTGRVDELYGLIQAMAAAGVKLNAIQNGLMSTSTHGTQEEVQENQQSRSSTSSSTSYSNYSDDSDLDAFVEEELMNHPSENLAQPLRSPLTGSVFNTPNSVLPDASFVAESTTSIPLYRHRYNLRERRSASVVKENDILQKESATDFAKSVKQARRTNRTQYQAARAVKMSCFSSDDEI